MISHHLQRRESRSFRGCSETICRSPSCRDKRSVTAQDSFQIESLGRDYLAKLLRYNKIGKREISHLPSRDGKDIYEIHSIIPKSSNNNNESILKYHHIYKLEKVEVNYCHCDIKRKIMQYTSFIIGSWLWCSQMYYGYFLRISGTYIKYIYLSLSIV